MSILHTVHILPMHCRHIPCHGTEACLSIVSLVTNFLCYLSLHESCNIMAINNAAIALTELMAGIECTNRKEFFLC